MMILLASVMTLMVGVSPEAEPRPIDRFETVANRLVRAINAGDYDAVQDDFAEIMREALPPAKINPILRALVSHYGRIRKLGPGQVSQVSTAVFPAQFDKGILDIKIVLDGNDKIAGLWFLPHQPAILVPEKHQTKLSLPFGGKWLVYWGGDTKKVNQHHDTQNQRFAFDFVMVDANGRTHKGQGLANEDYYAFGQSILAPADGVVTDVIRGVRDNKPGSMNPYSALGNAVVMRHREQEVSVLAHLKQGSIKVNVGDAVKAGQPLGLCGNSGNSSEPHLHYHLQNTPIIQDGTGIKCRFGLVTLGTAKAGEVKKEYSPVKGDIVGPAEGRAPAGEATAAPVPPVAGGSASKE